MRTNNKKGISDMIDMTHGQGDSALAAQRASGLRRRGCKAAPVKRGRTDHDARSWRGMTRSSFQILRNSFLVRIVGASAVWLTLCCVSVAPAHAESLGELGKVGEFGQGAGQFHYPTDLAVDPDEANSVFVLDEPESKKPGGIAEKARVQKFESTSGGPVGPKASVEIATPYIEENGEELGHSVAMIAVDPALGRLYLLLGRELSSGEYTPLQIDAYSTSNLQPVSEVDVGGEAGDYYDFPTAGAEGYLVEPQDMTVEPATHAIVVLGSDGADHTEIVRIATSGPKDTTGAFHSGEEYIDSTEALSNTNIATGIAAGVEEGVLYVTTPSLASGLGGEPGVAKLLTSGSYTLKQPHITLLRKIESLEKPELTGGQEGSDGHDLPGAQIAVTPEGGTVYAEAVSETGSAGTEGNYELVGISSTTGAREVVYGGAASGSSRCRIGSDRFAVAAGSGGIVYALNDGNWSAGKQTAFGFDLLEFGPGGGGCPVPTTSIEIDKSSAPARVEKGAEVKFEASAPSNGEEASKLVWSAEGPEAFTTEVSGAAGKQAVLTTTHRFLKPGDYTVKLEMDVTPESYGPVPTVTKTIEVTAPLPEAIFTPSTTTPISGEEVTFDASESLDPKGECSQSGCFATHKLKEYIWNFGDGSKAVTSTSPVVTHSFVDEGSGSLPDTVTLVVVNEEGVQSTATEEKLTIRPVEKTTTTTTTSSTEQTTSETTSSQTTTTQTTTTKTATTKTTITSKGKSLGKKEELARALKACRKDKSKAKRAKCEKTARKKYGPSKSKAKSKSKKTAKHSQRRGFVLIHLMTIEQP